MPSLTLPAESTYSDIERNWIENEPPGLLPVDQHSLWGQVRKVFAGYLQVNFADQLDTWYANLDPNTVNADDMPEWEELLGIPINSAGYTVDQRRAFILSRWKRGPFTRREWRNYKTVEPLLEKSLDGSINPTDLMNRVAASPYIKASQQAVGADDLVDLARIGKMMAKKGGSDTIHKGVLIGGGATLVGAIANPMVAVQGAATLAGNRALQSFYNQSPNMLRATIKKSTNPLHRFYNP